MKIIRYEDVQKGDTAHALNGKSWPVAEVASMNWIRLIDEEAFSDEWYDSAKNFAALGGWFTRNEPVEFECTAKIYPPGLSGQFLLPTLVLEHVGQDVPVGKVKVTMEHVNEGPVP